MALGSLLGWGIVYSGSRELARVGIVYSGSRELARVGGCI